MPIVTSGPYVGFSGTINGVTYYQLPNGKTVAKSQNRKSNKPPTEGQLSVRRDTILLNELAKPLEGFIAVGYELEAALNFDNPHNVMVSDTRANAMQGVYPNRSVDLSKVRMSKGSLPSANENSAIMTEQGIEFRWSTETRERKSHLSDQAMLLAYFPEIKDAEYVTGRVERHVGTDILNLEGIKKGNVAHAYISFITDDHKGISDSIYVGQFNW